MPQTSIKTARKANRGSFKPGPNQRRHKFTREDCSRRTLRKQV
jgi:hypothetical protein